MMPVFRLLSAAALWAALAWPLVAPRAQDTTVVIGGPGLPPVEVDLGGIAGEAARPPGVLAPGGLAVPPGYGAPTAERPFFGAPDRSRIVTLKPPAGVAAGATRPALPNAAPRRQPAPTEMPRLTLTPPPTVATLPPPPAAPTPPVTAAPLPQAEPAPPPAPPAPVAAVPPPAPPADGTRTATASPPASAPPPPPAASPAAPPAAPPAVVVPPAATPPAATPPVAAVPPPPVAPAAAAPAAPPAPAQTLARRTPAASTLGVGQMFRVLFKGATSTLTPDAESGLAALAAQLVRADNRLQLKAFAGNSAGTPSAARRLSLSRALAVRSFLIEQGVRSTRIDVRALGVPQDGGPAERVDAILLAR